MTTYFYQDQMMRSEQRRFFLPQLRSTAAVQQRGCVVFRYGQMPLRNLSSGSVDHGGGAVWHRGPAPTTSGRSGQAVRSAHLRWPTRAIKRAALASMASHSYSDYLGLVAFSCVGAFPSLR